MPTLAELVDGAYRDLADEAKEVFSVLQVEDFIRGGIADLNRVAPTDTTLTLDLVVDPDTGAVTQFSYDIPIELPYNIEIVRSADGWRQSLITGEDNLLNSQAGYTFRKTLDGGTIEFPAWFFQSFDPSVYTIRITGYAHRPLPYDTDPDPLVSPAVPLSEDEAYSVRAFARAQGLDLLAHDRSLFAQWQGQTNNTDVSPTQMMQMEANAKQEWIKHRNLIRVVRKYW